MLGKVGGDWYGDELVLKLNQERVQTRGIRFESKGDGEASRRTGCSYMRVKEMGKGRMGMEVVRNSPEDSLRDSELNLGVLKEVSRPVNLAIGLHFDARSVPRKILRLFKDLLFSNGDCRPGSSTLLRMS